MSIEVKIGIAETEIIIDKTLDTLPKSGDILTLSVDGKDDQYEVVDVDPNNGFLGDAPKSYRIYVRPVKP